MNKIAIDMFEAIPAAAKKSTGSEITPSPNPKAKTILSELFSFGCNSNLSKR